MNIAKKIPFLIPILIILLYIISPQHVIPFSYTIYGKLLTLLIIVYYLSINMIISVLLVISAIFYYKEDDIYLSNSEGFLWKIKLDKGYINE